MRPGSVTKTKMQVLLTMSQNQTFLAQSGFSVWTQTWNWSSNKQCKYSKSISKSNILSPVWFFSVNTNVKSKFKQQFQTKTCPAGRGNCNHYVLLFLPIKLNFCFQHHLAKTFHKASLPETKCMLQKKVKETRINQLKTFPSKYSLKKNKWKKLMELPEHWSKTIC